MIGLEVLAQTGLKLRDGLRAAARAQQSAREAMHLVGQHVIHTRYAHELGELALLGLVALAQYLYLALDQRDRGGVARVLQPHAREQLWVAFKKIRVMLQELDHELLVGGLRWNAAHLIARHP